MKSTIKSVGIAVLATALVFVLAGCEQPSGGGTTKWTERLIAMVSVPGGTFQRGSDTITLSGFYLGKYEVTQAQYEAVMETNPSYFKEDSNPPAGETQEKRPVESVSWYDAIEFCNALSIKEGLTPYYDIDKTTNSDTNNTSSYDTLKWKITPVTGADGYRLPTEAEWEYAARKGGGSPSDSDYTGSDTLDGIAWYDENSYNLGSSDPAYGTHEVGKKAANALGIYDMFGNVWEWCWDWYGTYPGGAQSDPVGASSGSSRVGRGGGWSDSAGDARSA